MTTHHPSSSIRSRAVARSARCRPRPRRGFTFAEVLFAVILLGIGFIMLAGMFPVAIQQTQTSISETMAAQLAQSAARVIQQNSTSTLLPPTTVAGTSGSYFMRMRTLATLDDIDDDLWERVKLDSIGDSDPRFAWSAVYRRDAGESVAQLVIFVVQARAYDIYAEDDTFGGTGSGSANVKWPATYEPRLVNVSVYFGNTAGNSEPDRVWFYRKQVASDSIYANEFDGLNFVTEGCYFVIASENDNVSRGSVYRTGRLVPPGDPLFNNPLNPTNIGSDVLCFELVPGSDMTSRDDNVPLVPGQSAGQAYVVGKGWAERPSPRQTGQAPPVHGDDPSGSRWPNNPFDPLVGRHQDVAVYTTFITIN